MGFSAHMNSQYSNADIETRSYIGGLRLETDVRQFFESSPLFVGVGLYGTVPVGSIRSTGYTEDEQEIYNDVASSWRAEIRGVGCRSSLGAELELVSNLLFGIRGDLSGYWSWLQLEQSGWERQFTLKSEPMIYFGIAW